MEFGFLFVVQSDIIFDGVGEATKKIGIRHDVCQALGQYRDRQCKGTRYSGKNLCLVLKICQGLSDRSALLWLHELPGPCTPFQCYDESV